MKKKTLRDIPVDGRRVLVRVDFNVPLDPQTHQVTDDGRIRAALPTIQYLVDYRARVILCSHLGRPKGREEGLSLAPVAARLGELLEANVPLAPDCVGPAAEGMVARLEPGQVLLLENLRFHPEEEANDPEFARRLASLAEVYVNDAFGAAHRAHASTVGVARSLPAVAGFLMERELDYLGKALSGAERPYAVVIGGAKIADKVTMLQRLLAAADKALIGGGVANTFLRAEGFEVGASLVEEDHLETARQVMETAHREGKQLMLPVDVVAADSFSAAASLVTVSVKDVPLGWMILDIGEKSVEVYGRALQGCKTVVWNGPMGVVEFPNAAHGSHGIAYAISRLPGATTIVGGGETGMVVRRLGIAEKFTHVSTGGGASLEFLEGTELPGVAALLDA